MESEPPGDEQIRRGGPKRVSGPRRVALGSAEVVRHTILGLVPFVGSAIDAAISELERQQAAASMDDFLRELCDFVLHLEKDKLDEAYVASADFTERLIQTCRLARLTRDKAKIRMYAAVLTNSMTLARASDLEPESILDTLADLSPGDVTILQDIWTGTQKGVLPYLPSYASAGGGHAAPSGIGENAEFHLLRLQRFGLIREKSGAYFDYSGGEYSATPTLRKLMAMVEEVIADEAAEPHGATHAEDRTL